MKKTYTTCTTILSIALLSASISLCCSTNSYAAKHITQIDENLVISTETEPQFLFKNSSLCGDVTGMLTKGDAGYIIKELSNCYYIKSGKRAGYISKNSVLCGSDAKKSAKKLCDLSAVINTDTAFLYSEPTTSSPVLNVYGIDTVLAIQSTLESWYKVKTVDGIEGYIIKNNTLQKISYTYASAPDLDIYADLYPEKALQQYDSNSDYDLDQTDIDYDFPENISLLGQQIADFACKFLGNPYVWGGESLIEGCDCSGFVMKIYEHFGYYLPHYSGSQRNCGEEVCSGENYDESLMIPGDIVCYEGHVGIYIGNGKIVNAANERLGIIICSATYRTDIVSVRRIISESPQDYYIQRFAGHGPMFLSAEEKGILERIVEAEAAGQGLRGKRYVADVILNRVDSNKFPNSVKKVVFATGQFQPVSNGRYYSVTVSEETKTAVAQAILSNDTSNGALYFMNRAGSDPNAVTWFDTALTKLFKYRDHEFFR